MPKRKRTYTVEIEARLVVHAFDADSATKKVQRALAEGRTLGDDVEAGGWVATYHSEPVEEPV